MIKDHESGSCYTSVFFKFYLRDNNYSMRLIGEFCFYSWEKPDLDIKHIIDVKKIVSKKMGWYSTVK